MLYQNLENERFVIFLFDEPGVYLHVNAQRELINLFEDLCAKGNQVVYTTHSPSMIDSNKLSCVRAIQKNDLGNTEILSITSDKIDNISGGDTLSPLLHALGMDLKYNLGPSSIKTNIITEGITDYYYITAMLEYFNIVNKPSVIPAIGASNIVNIASILIGWGCDFYLLYDYDDAGIREAKKVIKKFENLFNEKIVFVSCDYLPENDFVVQPKVIECLVSAVDFDAIVCNRENKSKTIIAKLFYDKVSSKSIKLSDETETAFIRLFSELSIMKISD